MLLPTILVAGATPLLAFAGALVGHRVVRRSAVELDRWRRREETMRMLRWSTELALADPRTGHVGVVALRELRRAELLQNDDKHLVYGVARAVISVREAYPGGQVQ